MAVNMQLPPPCVTGVAIPATLATKKDTAAYRELQSIRQQAREGLASDYKPINKGKKKTKTMLKIAAGIATALAAFIGIKKLIKK